MYLGCQLVDAQCITRMYKHTNKMNRNQTNLNWMMNEIYVYSGIFFVLFCLHHIQLMAQA